MATIEGSIALAQDYLRTTLSNCARFQTWTGAANAPAALASIYLDSLPDPAANEYTLAELQGYRPYALIWTDESGGFTYDIAARGAADNFTRSGRLKLVFANDTPTDTLSEVDALFKGTIGVILDELVALFGGGGYLDAVRMTVDAGPHRSHPDYVPVMGDYQQIEIGVEWGPG